VIVADVADVYVGVTWHVMQATRARLQQCCQLLCCAQHHLQHQHVHVHQCGHRHRSSQSNPHRVLAFFLPLFLRLRLHLAVPVIFKKVYFYLLVHFFIFILKKTDLLIFLIGLAAAKAAALRVNLNVQGCGIVAPPMHAPSRTPLLLPLLLSHNLPTPRVH
jgi:hypothetical protein